MYGVVVAAGSKYASTGNTLVQLKDVFKGLFPYS